MTDFYAPQGELSSFGFKKEATWNTYDTVDIFLPSTKWSPQVAKTMAARAPRGSYAATLPSGGGRAVTASLTCESSLDTFGPLLAYALGVQSAPSLTIVSTTLSAAATIGDKTITVASARRIFKGQILAVDTSTDLESMTVASVAGNVVTFTAALTKSHASAITVTCTATTAYYSKMTIGALPTICAEVYRPNAPVAATDYTGGKISTLALSLAASAALAPQVGFIFADSVSNGSPTTPSFSDKNPIVFEQQFAAPFLAGDSVNSGDGEAFSRATGATMTTFSLSLNNGLKASNFGLGGGNIIRNIPEGQRAITGSLGLQFDSAALRNAFDADRLGGALPACSLYIPLSTTDVIDSATGVNYAIGLWLPRIALSQDADDSFGSPTTQTVSWVAGDSEAGANDALTVDYIGSSDAAF